MNKEKRKIADVIKKRGGTNLNLLFAFILYNLNGFQNAMEYAEQFPISITGKIK